MLACCDGDIKLTNTGSGADVEIINGQPTLDDGLENAVFLSLFSPGGWWGNAVSEEAEQHNSTLESLMDQPLTNEVRLDVEEAARDALAWMVSEGVAKSVDAVASIPAPGWLYLEIVIQQPEGTASFRYNLNWSAMRQRVGA